MTRPLELCPIWNSNAATVEKYEVSGYFNHRTNVWHVDNSPRAAGGFVVPDMLHRSELLLMFEEQKARLTTWLIDQRNQGNEQPLINNDIIDYVKDKPALPVHERADRLLRCLVNSTGITGEFVTLGTLADTPDPYGHRGLSEGSTFWEAMAWSESIKASEVEFFLDYLLERGWIKGQRQGHGMGHFSVTIHGYSHIADVSINRDLSQAFVAMWFDESLNEAYDKGIKPAIERAGYDAFKINEKPDVDKIDDEIIGEIRRSRFLVADFTHGDKGARGSVYYEAGFAYGLGLPVVRSCRKDIIDRNELHFDVRQHYHVVWETPDELREGLENRIRALIGEGPKVHRYQV